MFSTCVDLAMKNLTQVEKLGSKSKAYQLAVLKPSSEELDRFRGRDILRFPILEITYPLELDQTPGAQKSKCFHDTSESDLPGQQSTVALQTYQPHQEVPSGLAELPSSGPAAELSSIPRSAALVQVSSVEQLAEHSKELLSAGAENNVVRPTQLDTSLEIQPNGPLQDAGRTGDTLSPRDNMATRTFGVLTMDPGDNPWDLGSRLLNLETVMGTNPFDCFLPFRRSPCCNHEDPESYYFVGPAVDVVRSKFYFMDAKDMGKQGGRQRPE
jgi:palmitoyltransferase